MALYLNAYSRTFSHSIRMNSKIEGWISLLHSACTCAMCMFTQSMRIFDFLCFSSFEFLRKEFCFAGTVFFISNQIDSPWCVCVCDYTITLTLRWIHSQTQTHAYYTIRPTVDGTKTSLNSFILWSKVHIFNFLFWTFTRTWLWLSFNMIHRRWLQFSKLYWCCCFVLVDVVWIVLDCYTRLRKHLNKKKVNMKQIEMFLKF